MANRSKLYQKGILKQHKLDVPVISVGNLVLGGTGKTPLVHYIAKFLQEHNKKPAILCRGYKGSATKTINVVSNSSSILLDAIEAGDEPRLLAEKLPGTPVITGKKRFTTGSFAISSFGAESLILDDGFQHMALKRDLDLVLFSAPKCLGNGRVLPGGELREPLSALKRADAFIISSIDVPLDRNVKEFAKLLESLYPEKPIFNGIYQPGNMLTRLHYGKSDSISQADASKIPLYGFCGIAKPESFKKILEMKGMKLSGFKAYEDHHAYSADNIKLLLDNAKNSGAEALVTTEKDLVKLRTLFPQEFPLFILPVHLNFGEDFDRFLSNSLKACKTSEVSV
jgi:tetraacyldisaccharide 4'-kinase